MIQRDVFFRQNNWYMLVKIRLWGSEGIVANCLAIIFFDDFIKKIYFTYDK